MIGTRKGRLARQESFEQRHLRPAGTKRPLSHRLTDYLVLHLKDHGFIRSVYLNHHILPGELHRMAQPSPGHLHRRLPKHRIRTMINLRGENATAGWHRLEVETCERLGIRHVNCVVHSRGLPTPDRLLEIKDFIESVETPAAVHCKSGADRAGFFSALWCVWRCGMPVEEAKEQLHIRYGHIRRSKTGILDHFFNTYLAQRRSGQSLEDWIKTDYDRDAVEASFSYDSAANILVDFILRRE